MPIPFDTEQWLDQAGYEYHCFISWAHVESTYMVRFAHNLKGALHDRLAEQVTKPSVFLDEDDIPPGHNWRPDLARKLCRSLSMVALCAPIYFRPTHPWCGLEWATMSKLGSLRLGSSRETAIIPIVVSEIDEPPAAFSTIQHIDVSFARLRGGFFRSNDFRTTVGTVVRQIESIARRVHQRSILPNCETADFPTEPAFAGYGGKRPGLPLTGET